MRMPRTTGRPSHRQDHGRRYGRAAPATEDVTDTKPQFPQVGGLHTRRTRGRRFSFILLRGHWRGDWPGALLCPVKGGRIQPRDMTAQAVMVRVRTIAEQAGVDLVTPNDLRLTYLTELERQRLDARTKGRPERVPAPVMRSLPYQAP